MVEVFGKVAGTANSLIKGAPCRIVQNASPRHCGVAQVYQHREKPTLGRDGLEVAIGAHPTVPPGIIEKYDYEAWWPRWLSWLTGWKSKQRYVRRCPV